MIDNITLYIDDFITTRNRIPEWQEYFPKPKKKKKQLPKKHHYFRRKVYNKKNRAFLLLSLRYDDEEDIFRLRINGSIRKWYYGENNRKDLNLSEIKDCMRILSIKIGVSEETLLNARNTKLENGITILLKSDIKSWNKCFVKHRNFNREEIESTVYFKGKVNKSGEQSNYNIKIYEKFSEIHKHDRNFYTNSAKMKMHKKLSFLRFEIDINKVSGMTFYKDNANTMQKIIFNWKKIVAELLKRFKAIHFVDLNSKEKIIDTAKLNKRDTKKHLQFKAIIENGFYEEFEKFNASNISTNRSTKLKLFLKNFEMFLDKKTDYQKVLLVAFKKKLARLT